MALDGEHHGGMSTATTMVQQYLAAETAVLSGQSYKWGERQLTMADLAEIRAGRAEWEARVAGEQRRAAGGGRFLLADFRSGR